MGYPPWVVPAPDTPSSRVRYQGPPLAVCPDCGEPFWDSDITHCPNDGTPLQASGDGGPQTRVDRVVGGRYRLLGQIGEGGMGTVYIAEHAASLRRVAMKIIRPELESSKLARERFLRECRTLEKVKSPHVVEVLESGESPGGEIFLVMELLEGETLGDRLDRDGALPVNEVASIGGQVASALATAHAQGIVHRDMKPDNIFLCHDGTARVLDFGIARLLDAEMLDGSNRKLTATGAIIGTPTYISPEQAAGREVGLAADNYSFGVVLFEMLTGRTPFVDEHPVLLMGLHLKEPAPSIRDVRPDLPYPDEVVDLVDALLRKDPKKRPEGEEVRRILGELGSGIHTLPRKGSSAPLETGATRMEGAPAGLTTAEMTPPDRTPSARSRRRGSKRGLLYAIVAGAVLLAVAVSVGAWKLVADASGGDEGAVDPVADPSGLPSTGPSAPTERDVPSALGSDPVSPELPPGLEPPLELEPEATGMTPAEPTEEGGPSETADPEPQAPRRGSGRRGSRLSPTIQRPRPLGQGPSTGRSTRTGRAGRTGRGDVVRDYY